MTRKYQIRPVRPDDLGDVAGFLHRWWDAEGGERPADSQVRKDRGSIETCLRWLLLENPANPDSHLHGNCLRDDSGTIRGVLLHFPGKFVLGEQTIPGLCSGSFFVDPEVRTGGFYLFRRYLGAEGYSFFFSNTCNAHSSALWEKSGAHAAPDSGREFIIPIRSEVVLRAFLERRWNGRSRSTSVTTMAKLLGACANAIPKFAGRSKTLRVEVCGDWEKLSALARRHRPPELLTSERSPAFIAWRYGPGSPNHGAELCLFRDTRGNEGWFALGNRMLGPRGQIAACIVLDAVWPRQAMTFGEILPAIFHHACSRADAIYLLPRPGVDHASYSRWVVPRRLEARRIWTLPGRGAAPLDMSSLDLVTADGDSGWSNRYQTRAFNVIRRGGYEYA